MNLFALLNAAFLTALPPMAPDTPPPLPVPAERVVALKTMEDVIGATVLADGSRAPAHLVLPQLSNRLHTLEFMRVHYPEKLRKKVSKKLAVAWVYIDEEGKTGEVSLVTSSGYPALDSLSLRVMQIAAFRPAQLDGKPVGVWVPFPARIPPHDELIATLAAMTADVTDTPMETPHTQKPVLLNRNQVEAAIVRIRHGANRALAEMNEMFQRPQNAGGKIDLWIYIDATGSVAKTIIKKTSGNKDLDASAENIARMMRFAPAKNGDTPVDIWIEVPIQFKER